MTVRIPDRRSRPTRKWRIAHKLTVASLLMILLTLLAGVPGGPAAESKDEGAEQEVEE